MTEKITAVTDKLDHSDFIARPEANKLGTKDEVEAFHDVTVADVNTAKYAGKNKSHYTKVGIVNGRTNTYRKTVMILKGGDIIDFYSNA